MTAPAEPARPEAGRDGPLGWALVAAQLALLGALGLEVLRGPRAGLARLAAATVLATTGGAFAATGVGALGRRLRAHPAPPDDAVLRTDGPYGVVRHPIYLGLLLAAAAAALLARTPRAAACVLALGAVFHLKAGIEERLLRERFEAYDAYAERVPRLLPRVP